MFVLQRLVRSQATVRPIASVCSTLQKSTAAVQRVSVARYGEAQLRVLHVQQRLAVGIGPPQFGRLLSGAGKGYGGVAAAATLELVWIKPSRPHDREPRALRRSYAMASDGQQMHDPWPSLFKCRHVLRPDTKLRLPQPQR